MSHTHIKHTLVRSKVENSKLVVFGTMALITGRTDAAAAGPHHTDGLTVMPFGLSSKTKPIQCTLLRYNESLEAKLKRRKYFQRIKIGYAVVCGQRHNITGIWTLAHHH